MTRKTLSQPRASRRIFSSSRGTTSYGDTSASRSHPVLPYHRGASQVSQPLLVPSIACRFQIHLILALHLKDPRTDSMPARKHKLLPTGTYHTRLRRSIGTLSISPGKPLSQRVGLSKERHKAKMSEVYRCSEVLARL